MDAYLEKKHKPWSRKPSKKELALQAKIRACKDPADKEYLIGELALEKSRQMARLERRMNAPWWRRPWFVVLVTLALAAVITFLVVTGILNTVFKLGG